MGIDYGMGKQNIDNETGIRFGFIPMNDLASWAWDDIESHGTDLDFEDHKDQLKKDLSSAINNVLDEYGHDRNNDSDELAGEIVENLEWDNYQGSQGDCTRYLYEHDGYKVQVCGDGDAFVLKSPYYTNAPFCSPCAPGAGYLRDGSAEGDCKAYCMGHDWFEDQVAPYPVFRVDNDQLVQADKE